MQKQLSPVQRGVEIVTNISQLGCSSDHYQQQIEELHELMAQAATNEVREALGDRLPESVRVMPVSVAALWFSGEENEGSPEAEAYWAATSKFFRRIYQACAAGCN
jgi:hypothetical protein